MTTQNDLKYFLRLTHQEVHGDILRRQAGKQHYMVRGLYHYSGRSAATMTTLDGAVVIVNGAAANRKEYV